MTRNGSEEFYKILDEAETLHDKKSHDYATNNNPFGNYQFAGMLAHMFRDQTDAGLIGRLGEKLYRLSNLEYKEPQNETVEDTELDLVVIMGLFVANRRERRKRNEQKSPYMGGINPIGGDY